MFVITEFVITEFHCTFKNPPHSHTQRTHESGMFLYLHIATNMHDLEQWSQTCGPRTSNNYGVSYKFIDNMPIFSTIFSF